MIRLLVLAGLLVYCSIWDIRTGMLPVVPLLILAVPGFLWRILSGNTVWWIFLSSFFPAAVLYLISAVSKGFGKGDVLMILEAMKMENEIMAPCDGTISQVCTS